MNQIQPLANIHPDARLGEGVIVEPFATIAADVEIGAGTRICANAVIMNGARIGCNCVIYPGAVIAGEPQDLKFRGEVTTAVIGDRTTIRECVTVSRGTASKGTTIIGSDCLIMAYSHVAHDCVVGNHVIVANASQIAGEVVVDDHAVIGGGSLIHQFCHIGAHVMIQGGSQLPKDVPPYVTVGRTPVSYMGINSIGLRRRGFTSEMLTDIKDTYNIIYQSGLNISDAVRHLEETDGNDMSPERRAIVEFIKGANRGIVRGYTTLSHDD